MTTYSLYFVVQSFQSNLLYNKSSCVTGGHAPSNVDGACNKYVIVITLVYDRMCIGVLDVSHCAFSSDLIHVQIAQIYIDHLSGHEPRYF